MIQSARGLIITRFASHRFWLNECFCRGWYIADGSEIPNNYLGWNKPVNEGKCTISIHINWWAGFLPSIKKKQHAKTSNKSKKWSPCIEVPDFNFCFFCVESEIISNIPLEYDPQPTVYFKESFSSFWGCFFRACLTASPTSAWGWFFHVKTLVRFVDLEDHPMTDVNG